MSPTGVRYQSSGHFIVLAPDTRACGRGKETEGQGEKESRQGLFFLSHRSAASPTPSGSSLCRVQLCDPHGRFISRILGFFTLRIMQQGQNLGKFSMAWGHSNSLALLKTPANSSVPMGPEDAREDHMIGKQKTECQYVS